MLYRITNQDIISVALLYKYLQDKSETVCYYDAGSYIKEVSAGISTRLNKKFDASIILNDDESEENYKRVGIKKEKQGFQYKIDDLEQVVKTYLSLPEEMTDVTLRRDLLEIIDVNRNNLRLSETDKKIRGYTDINALSAAYAIEWTNKYLQDFGCHNIKIHSTFFSEGSAFGGFNTSYEADRSFKKVDVKSYKLEYIKKQPK